MTESEINYRRHGSRYRARRRAVDIIFESEARDVDPVAVVDERTELSKKKDSNVAPIAEYTRELVTGTAQRLDELDEAIARYLSETWELRRLPAVDRAILRVMAWEILYNDDVDAPISITDAVEIATQYSTDVASPYIHAVLDDIAQSASEQNPMNFEPDVDVEDTEVTEVSDAQADAPETEAAETDDARGGEAANQ